MENLINILFGRKVIIALAFLLAVSLFTYALYNSNATISATGYIIKSLANG